MASDPEAVAELTVKEINAGRPSMFSLVGSRVWVFTAGNGPVEVWAVHRAGLATNKSVIVHDRMPADQGRFQQLW